MKETDGGIEARRDEMGRRTNKKVRMRIGIRGLEELWEGKGEGDDGWGGSKDSEWSRGKTRAG